MDGTILLTEVSHTTESRIKEARNNNLLNETVEHKPNSHSGKSLRSTTLKQAKSDPPPVFFFLIKFYWKRFMPIYLHMATFVTHWQNWAAVTEVIRLANSKMFILCPFTFEVYRSLFLKNEKFRNWWEFSLKANYIVKALFLCTRHWQVLLSDSAISFDARFSPLQEVSSFLVCNHCVVRESPVQLQPLSL